MRIRILVLICLVVPWLTLSTRPPMATETVMEIPDSSTSMLQQASDYELVGQIGGDIRAVAVRDTLAYVGVGPRLMIFDISDPTQINLISETSILSGVVVDIGVSSHYAYVLTSVLYAGNFGLHIVDVTDPYAPTNLGFYDTPGIPMDMTIAGNYAYIADYDGGLRVVDISNPYAPAEVGSYSAPALFAMGVKVRGHYAYLAALSRGLRIIDVSNPTAPTEVSYHTTPGNADHVALAGNYAYVGTGLWHGSTGMDIVDITNPAVPTEAGFYTHAQGAITDMEVSGNNAYIVDEGGGLYIVDITNPATPVELGHYDTSETGWDVALAGTHAYFAHSASLSIVDVADPETPTQIDVYDSVTGVGRTAAGTYAYVIGSPGQRMRILDASNPAAPAWIGFYDAQAAIADIAATSDYAYLVDGDLQVIDISNPTTPHQVGAYVTPGSATTVALLGDYAYVSDSESGLRIISIANPTAPAEVGFYDTPGTGEGVTVVGSYAYVSDGSGDLRIIDVSNPNIPTEIGLYDGYNSITAAAVTGNYAYLADGDLQVIDVSNPTTPTHVASLQTLGRVFDVTVAGNYAFVNDDSWPVVSLHIIDISTPTAPIAIAEFIPPAWRAWDTALSANYAYVTDGSGGIDIVQLAPWLLPPSVTTIPGEGGTAQSIYDQTAYVFLNGTFTDTVVITHTARKPTSVPSTGDLIGIDHFFETTAVYSGTNQPAQPTQPYTLTVQYTDQEKGPAIEDTLALYSWDGNQWMKEPSSVVDAANNIVTATPDHFSLWAILGETHRVFLPATLKSH